MKLDGSFDADQWYAAFRAGHVFVTNGPMLEFSIDEAPMDGEIRVRRGARLDLVAMARLNADIDRLDRLEVVVHGEVVATARANGQDSVELRQELTAETSMWIAIRAFGVRESQPQGQPRPVSAVAHSAPIYVIVDGEPSWNSAAVPQRVQEQRQHLRDLLSAPVDAMSDLEAWETVDVLSPLRRSTRGAAFPAPRGAVAPSMTGAGVSGFLLLVLVLILRASSRYGAATVSTREEIRRSRVSG